MLFYAQKKQLKSTKNQHLTAVRTMNVKFKEYIFDKRRHLC